MAGSAKELFAEGNRLAAAGNFAAALECYGSARAIWADAPAIHHNIGIALAKLGREVEAITAYRRAVELDPGLHGTFNSLGNALRDLGRFDEACMAYRRAIQLAPRKAAYYRNLVHTGGLALDDPLLLVMQRLSEEGTSLPHGDRVSAHFALADALGQGGRHAESFDHLLVGNKLRRSQVAYDEAATMHLLERIRAVFTPELVVGAGCGGHASAMPVFIVGMPRSGSTLIEQILASHPAVFGAGERAAFPQALAECVSRLEDALLDPMTAASLSDGRLARLGADYLDRLESAAATAASGYQRITDKYLANFLYLGLVHMTLPNARIIHCRRSPVDTCLSCFSHLFEDVPFSYDLGELGRYYRAYAALMAHWRVVLPPSVMLDVQYEDLVTNFAAEARRMLTHCGLPWHDACAEFYTTSRVVRTESALQVHRPIYRTSIERWRPEQRLLRPLLDGLGDDLLQVPSRGYGEEICLTH